MGSEHAAAICSGVGLREKRISHTEKLEILVSGFVIVSTGLFSGVSITGETISDISSGSFSPIFS